MVGLARGSRKRIIANGVEQQKPMAVVLCESPCFRERDRRVWSANYGVVGGTCGDEKRRCSTQLVHVSPGEPYMMLALDRLPGVREINAKCDNDKNIFS